jgi:tRNA-2-methylthio-N6-dimethylallyladenosine synthase
LENKNKKSVYLKTFGCQMNEHDSRRILELLRPLGYELVDQPETADLILVNTCSVRAKSQDKVLSMVGRFRHLKERRGVILGVTGCVAEQEGTRLLRAAPYLDLVIGPDHLAELPELLATRRRRRETRTGFTEISEYAFLRATPRAGAEGATGLVTIQKGCDNYCSYCIVPLVRGREVSRRAEEILAEVDSLAAAGVREVTLIGQNVNSYRGYHGGEEDFVLLLRMVCARPGLCRVRFTTSHPKDFSRALARCFGELETLCPWLHLPVQSGSTAVLERMNRRYTRETYLQAVGWAREACPEVTIGTDLIVGFPGEREADFAETLSLIEEVRFDYSYSFKYSSRPGTRAAELADDLPEEEKSRRLRLLQGCQGRITRASLASWVGRELVVLVEGASRRGGDQLCGRAPGNQVVNFRGTGIEAGSLVAVKVEAAGGHSLSGTVARVLPPTSRG